MTTFTVGQTVKVKLNPAEAGLYAEYEPMAETLGLTKFKVGGTPAGYGPDNKGSAQGKVVAIGKHPGCTGPMDEMFCMMLFGTRVHPEAGTTILGVEIDGAQYVYSGNEVEGE